MLYEIVVAGYVTLCILLGIIILVQPSKSSSGIGAFSGETQMLFGGSGGQDFLQKATWVMGALLMLGSLTLSLWKTTQEQTSIVRPQPQQQEEPQQGPQE